MLTSLLKRFRAAVAPPESLRQLLALQQRMPLCAGLSHVERQELSRLAWWLMQTKTFTGQEEMAVDDAMRGWIALQMALPALHLGEAALKGWQEIILYPDAFVTRDSWMDHIGLQHEGESILVGQARMDGPLVLSWPDTQRVELDGWNVVIHEMAHKLDMINGSANGSPPLHKGMDQKEWSRVFSRSYRGFCRLVDRGIAEQGWLDPYASENPAEFFAVLSEAFFGLPHHVKGDLPEVYSQLSLFYRQDPAGRIPEPQWTE